MKPFSLISKRKVQNIEMNINNGYIKIFSLLNNMPDDIKALYIKHLQIVDVNISSIIPSPSKPQSKPIN